MVKKPAPPEQLWWVPVVVLKERETEDVSAFNISTTPASWLRPDLHQLTLQGYSDDNKYIIVNPGTVGKGHPIVCALEGVVLVRASKF